VTITLAEAQHLRDLALLRRVRNRIDREYAQPLDVEALARPAHMSAGHLSHQSRLAYGESAYSCPMTRRIERDGAAKGTYASVILATTDVDGTFERLQANAEVVQEPPGQPDGVRDCAVRDPAGNPIRMELR
jgi:hypothetical protein